MTYYSYYKTWKVTIVKSLFVSWKIERKEKKLKSNFLFHVWFEENSKKKNWVEKYKKNLCYEENFFLPNMRGKWRKKLFLIASRKR